MYNFNTESRRGEGPVIETGNPRGQHHFFPPSFESIKILNCILNWLIRELSAQIYVPEFQRISNRTDVCKEEDL